MVPPLCMHASLHCSEVGRGRKGKYYSIGRLVHFSSLLYRVMSNFQLLERRHRSNKDSHVALQDKLQRTERTKNCIDTELNGLKPEIKQMQQEKGNLYR